MPETHEAGDAVVHSRLEPAGLTGLLGPYGEGRGPVLAIAMALLGIAGALLVLVPAPPASIGMAFIIPVALIAAERGVRAGLLCAAASTAMLLGWSLASGANGDGVGGILLRSSALFFLGWVATRAPMGTPSGSR